MCNVGFVVLKYMGRLATQKVVRVYHEQCGYDDVFERMWEVTEDRGRSTWLVKRLSFDLMLHHNWWLRIITWQSPAWKEDDRAVLAFLDDPVEGLVMMYEEE